MSAFFSPTGISHDYVILYDVLKGTERVHRSFYYL